MCENIKKLAVDVDKLALENQDSAIEFIHGQWLKAEEQLGVRFQSESHDAASEPEHIPI